MHKAKLLQALVTAEVTNTILGGGSSPSPTWNSGLAAMSALERTMQAPPTPPPPDVGPLIVLAAALVAAAL